MGLFCAIDLLCSCFECKRKHLSTVWTEALFYIGRAEAGSSCLSFFKQENTLLICCPQFVSVAFFCTNTENCFNAGNWNYFNIFDCIPIFMSCWNVKCTWTVLLMLVCENTHFSINPFCTRLPLTVFTGLGKLSAFSPYCFKQIPWGSMITVISLIKMCFYAVHRTALGEAYWVCLRGQWGTSCTWDYIHEMLI